MYAILETGGKQYEVKKNSEIYIELLPDQKAGDQVVFDKVLLVNDDNKTTVGKPYIKGAKVTGKLVKNGKQKKVIIFKYKKRNNDAVKKGHRQPYSLVKITDITV